MKSFCIILTHRHGACIGLVLKKPVFLKNSFEQTALSFIHNKNQNLQKHENFEFFFEKGEFICARVLGKTAENLSNLFQFAFITLGCSLNDIENIVVSIGPGSFTGLRLGAAFANGINFGFSHIKLYSVTTPFLETHQVFDKNIELKQAFQDDLGAHQVTDASSGYVTFFDLFYAMHQIFEHHIIPSHAIIPHYGKEPSPVLNLRKE